MHSDCKRYASSAYNTRRQCGVHPAKSAISENNYWIQWIRGSNSILGTGGKKKEREEKKNVQGESYFVTRIKERRFYFYTPAGDDTRLFQLLDQHSHMPLLLGFQEYILTEARRCGALTPLTVLSSTETFDATKMNKTSVRFWKPDFTKERLRYLALILMHQMLLRRSGRSHSIWRNLA